MANDARRNFYRPELDLLRFVAFLLVFLSHGLWADLSPVTLAISKAGVSGLALFFLLSSYLITELLLREHASTGTVHLKAFYLRRVLRIWPLYLLALLMATVLARFGFGYFSDGSVCWRSWVYQGTGSCTSRVGSFQRS